MGELAYRVKKESYTNYDLLFCLYETGLARDFDLKQSTLSTLACLCRYYNPSTGVVFPSMETIADKINAGERTVSRAIEELISKGLLLKTKNGKHNVYIFGNIFWQYIKGTAEKSNLVTCQKRKNTCQNDNRIPAILTGEQNNHEQNKKHISSKKQNTVKIPVKTNDDAFQKLSFIDLRQQKTVNLLKQWNVWGIQKLFEEHGADYICHWTEYTAGLQCKNYGAYFRNLINNKPVIENTSQKPEAVTINEPENLKELLNSVFWKHTPSGKIFKSRQEDNNQPLFIYHEKSQKIDLSIQSFQQEDIKNFEHSDIEAYKKFTGYESDNIQSFSREDALKWCRSIHPGARGIMTSFKNLVQKYGFTEADLAYSC